MAKSNKRLRNWASNAEKTLAEASMEKKEDPGPVNFPYSGDIWFIVCEDRYPVMSIHRHLVEQHPKLAARRKQANQIVLDIPNFAGHVLIHYLYTTGYSATRPQGETIAVRDALELSAAIRICDLAAEIDMPGLCDLAVEKIKEITGKTTLPHIIRIIETFKPSPATMLKLAPYIALCMKSCCDNITPEASANLLTDIGKPDTLSSIIFTTFILMHKPQE